VGTRDDAGNPIKVRPSSTPTPSIPRRGRRHILWRTPSVSAVVSPRAVLCSRLSMPKTPFSSSCSAATSVNTLPSKWTVRPTDSSPFHSAPTRLPAFACFYSTRSSMGSSRPKPIPPDMEPSDMESAFVSPSTVLKPSSPSPFSYLTSLSFSSYVTSVGVTHSRIELDAVTSYRMSSSSRYLPLRSWVHADFDWKASDIRASAAEQAQLRWSAHVASSHAGIDATLAELRARSPAPWPQQRAQVGLMLSCCVRCQLSKSQPHRYPHPTPVPSPVRPRASRGRLTCSISRVFPFRFLFWLMFSPLASLMSS